MNSNESLFTNLNFIIMKINKFLLNVMLAGVFIASFIGYAQEKEKESYEMVNLQYIMPKIGMEKAFEKAAKEHNNLYHKEGPYKASIDYILTGSETGWYVWLMGPNTFSDLDGSPGEGAHADHWNKFVAPTIAEYGRSEFWKYNEKLSYNNLKAGAKYENIWILDLKRGDYYRFKAMMLKIKEAHEKKADDSILIYENQFNGNDGRDIAIVWPFNSWAELDIDNGGIKKTYEEINGEGSWQNAMDEWSEFTESINSHVWRIGL
jgi:hypothetical protein